MDEVAYIISVVLCGLSMLLAWTMVYMEKKGRHGEAFFAKVLASVCFVSSGFIAATFSDGSKALMLLMLGGLVFGMLGDIFLCRTHVVKEAYWDAFLYAGGGFFFMGHLCYFAAAVGMGGLDHLLIYLIVPVLMGLVFYLMKSQIWKVKKKRWPGYMCYALVSGLMLSGAIELMIEQPLPEEMVLAAAAMIFILSDLALATWNFGKLHTLWMRYTCITLYYLAQILFVAGIWLN